MKWPCIGKQEREKRNRGRCIQLEKREMPREERTKVSGLYSEEPLGEKKPSSGVGKFT